MDNFQRRKGQQLMALFFLGGLLFNYPVLSIFSSQNMIFGIPVLYIYIFISWAFTIGLTAIVIEWRK
jgi:hypothetical protein